MSRINVPSFTLILFFFAAGSVFAQSAIPTFSSEQVATHGNITVLILVAASSDEENKTVTDILSQSIRIEVENAGFKSELRSLTSDRLKDILSDSAELNTRLLKLSKRAKADFTIFCEYSLKKDILKSEYSLFDVEKVSIINRRSEAVKLDLTSDIAISSAIAGLIKDTEQRIEEVAVSKPVTTESSGTTENAKAGKQPPGGSTSQNRAGKGTTAGLAEEIKSEKSKNAASEHNENSALTQRNGGRIIKGGDVIISIPKVYKHLDFGLGFASFIPIGDLSDYLHIAYNPYAFFSYRVFVPFGIAGIGFRAGSNIGYAAGIAQHGILALSPIGIDFSYSTFRMAFLSLFLRTSGGMAVITFFPEGGAFSGAAVPYAETGAGLNFFLTDSFKLSTEVAYSVYFNPDPLIMGLGLSLMLSLLL